MIPDSFKQDLLNRVDIVDVVSSRVPLKKSGANWTGLCPFHSEKTPSFTVSEAKQFYHCFGCGAHGNAIGFLMDYSGLGYIEALTELADAVGMKLPDRRDEPLPSKTPESPKLYDLLEQAAAYYRAQLKGSERAIQYLKNRGVVGKTAAMYGIGYAPSAWQGLAAVFPDYADKALVDAGLVIESDGKRYDRFRDRVMFPIFNSRGVLVGYGGRLLEDGGDSAAGPKYLNSPETAVFEKGRELYGLPQARVAIRAANRIIVVEGYVDVVMLAQHGVANAVATLGTATTAAHVQKLLKLADDVVFCFDGDAAGRRAAWHALEVSVDALSDRKTVRFLFLPEAHDPDSYVRAFGSAAFESEMSRAQPLSAFLLATLESRNDLVTFEGRSRLIAEAKPLIRRLAAPALRVQLVKALAEMAGMTAPEAARLMELGDGTILREERRPARTDRISAIVDRRTERRVLECLLVAPELERELDIQAIDEGCAEGRAVLQVVAFLRGAPGVRTVAGVLEAFRNSEYESYLAAAGRALLETKLDPESAAAELRGAQDSLLNKKRKARHTELGVRIQAKTATAAEVEEFSALSMVRAPLKLASRTIT